MAPQACPRRASRRACLPSSTGCASRTSPTFISACPRAGAARFARLWSGSWSASPTSSASPATSCRAAPGCRSSRSGFARSAAATWSSATTISPTAATRSPSASIRRRSPLSRTSTLLGDDAVEVELRGQRVQIVGVDPQAYTARRPLRTSSRTRRPTCESSSATSRESSTRIPSVFHLVLAGHLHAGQIVVPYPGGRLAPRAPPCSRRRGRLRLRRDEAPRVARSRHDVRPFRLFARPEVTELVVRSA